MKIWFSQEKSVVGKITWQICWGLRNSISKSKSKMILEEVAIMKILPLICLSVGLALTIVAPVPPAMSYKKDWAKVLEAGKKEGALVVAASSSLGGKAGVVRD